MTEESQALNGAALPPVAMHDSYGPLLRSFFARYFNPIAFPPEAIEKVRELAEEGTVVYVAPAASLLHFLYLNHVCVRHGLPLARFVNGVDPVLFQPVSLLWERLRRMGEDDECLDEDGEQEGQRELIDTISASQSALLFLDQPTTITNPHADQETDGQDMLANLIQLQQTRDEPIHLLPHLIKWNVHPEREDRGVADAIFGQAAAPGLLRTLYLMMRHYRKAVVKVAAPLNLKTFLAEQESHKLGDLVSALQAQLDGQMNLEVYDVAGPRIRPHADFRDEVLADPMIHDFIIEQAGDDESRLEALKKKAFDMLDEIAAEPRIRWPIMLDKVLNLFWNRMYEGIVVDEVGFERIRQAIRKSPVIFCPSHKSHVDYLVMSQLCLTYKVPLPHIAAGVNLSFWPMGPIFRHSGAFFMRRSFKGEALYPIVFRTYLRHVMKEGFPIEFFIEGTRSRTGKLLSPRYGILSWLLQAFLEGGSQDLQFMPISVDYEKLVESKAYVRELSGGSKRKEDVAGLFKARKALRTKYGKVYVQVGEPISVRQVLDDRDLDREDLSPDNRRLLAQDVAHRILFDINGVSTVTPSALVAFSLLNHRRRGMAQPALLERARWLLDWVSRRGARLSGVLDDFERALAEAIARFSRDGAIIIRDTGEELVYSVVEDRRLSLDYYRNNLLHHFTTASLTMTAIESFTVEAVPRQALSERIRDLSRLFKNEFLFRSERHFEDELQKALDDLAAEGTIAIEDGFVVKRADGSDLRKVFCAVLEHFIEAYWLAAQSLPKLGDKAHSERDFIGRILSHGDRLFVQGDLLLRESMSRDIIKNAMKTFAERGLIKSYQIEGKRGSFIELSDEGRAEGVLDKLADSIRVYLQRET